ncbi:phosphopantetheine-binding protein, partial [Burkholderia sola]|uniref:phosphopantetheine-binding protein n=1 Tax=Burkholderia sola TaxID=2843302 RepID=UPI00338EE91D
MHGARQHHRAGGHAPDGQRQDRPQGPARAGAGGRRSVRGAQGEAEQALTAVWADLFGLERAGRHDDFFALGGDSILALKLVARARKRGLNLTPKQLFTGKTPAGVARLVEAPAAG